jgi:hypothetical protein
LEKALVRPPTSEEGPGKSELAELKLAVVESLRPNGTPQLGPPS